MVKRRETIRLVLLFATSYLVQGMTEPTTGVVLEPVESLLKRWGESPVQIASFLALIGIPWCFKPLFGFLSDFRPLFGFRRRSYLLLATAAGTLAFSILTVTHLTHAREESIRAWLFLATMAVAATDVVLDARMLDVTKPVGLTPRIQSVQYGAAHVGAITAGVLGGRITASRHTSVAFALCAGLMALQWWLVLRRMREEPTSGPSTIVMRVVRRAFVEVLRSRAAVAVLVLMVVFYLNPFTQASIYMFLTGHLRIHDVEYGNVLAWSSAGGLVGTMAYGSLGTRLSLKLRTHIGIAGGVLSNLVYLTLASERGAYAVGFLSGFTYMLGGLALIDLGARICPVDASGTVYAALMALCNLCAAIGTWTGGWLYLWFTAHWGATAGLHAFASSSAVGAALCWIVVPWIPWHALGLGDAGEPSPRLALHE